tara:strand:- start:8651 stop:9016 length:366 start_codon:yes stop_codon:yes gene_type:complete
MKAVLRKIVLLVFFIVSLFSYAANNKPTPKLKFKTIYSDTFVLYVTSYENIIQVKLYSDTGVLVFSENLGKGYAYKKTYDISGLSDGTYYAKVIDNNEVKLFCVVKGDKNKISEVEKLPYE